MFGLILGGIFGWVCLVCFLVRLFGGVYVWLGYFSIFGWGFFCMFGLGFCLFGWVFYVCLGYFVSFWGFLFVWFVVGVYV